MNLMQLKVELGKLIKLNLQQNGLRQLDLAEHLQLSTSAVSQMITGKVSPSTIHFKKMVKYLKCSDNNISEMVALLTQIRSGMSGVHLPKSNVIKMPVVSVDDLLKFCPALEDLKTFVNRNCKQENSSKGANDSIDYENTFEILASGDRFDPPFPGLLNLIVTVENFPEKNDTVLAKSPNNDKLQLKKIYFEDNNIYLMPFNGIPNKQDLKADNLEWVRKVLKVTVRDL